MNYQQFRALRDRLVAESELLRLDCMNPAKALTAFTPPPTAGGAPPKEALRAWLDLYAPNVDLERTAITTGIRPALKMIFSRLKAAGADLWLPEDVYPEYWNLAAESAFRCRPFVTLPVPDLAPLCEMGASAAMLLPQPLAPLGRYLSAEEVDSLRSLLQESPRRRLVLDTVYHLDNKPNSVAQALWESGQTYLVHSLAKSWLLPETLGVTLTPPGEARLTSADSPTPQAAKRGADVLRRFKTRPHEIEAVFRRQWSALADRIRVAAAQWEPPATGYFSVIAVPFEELLRRHRMLAVPASVFGSRRNDLSVISCLYYSA